MAKQLTEGDVISLILPLAKATSLKYESVGIVSISEGPSSNQITFVLANGSTHTVSFTFSATGISFTPPTGMTSTNVQNAIVEILNQSLSKITSLNMTVGQETITYDTTDGVTVNANGNITWGGGTSSEQQSFTSEFNIPMVAGSGISMDANQAGTQLTIKSVAEYITITAPTTATSGTLTNEQLTKLQSSENVHIMFNNELYSMQSKGHIEGYITYSMSEYESNVTTIKSITVTIAGGSWVLNTVQVPSVSISSTGTSTTEAKYITINGTEYKVGGSQGYWREW